MKKNTGHELRKTGLWLKSPTCLGNVQPLWLSSMMFVRLSLVCMHEDPSRMQQMVLCRDESYNVCVTVVGGMSHQME